MAIDITSVRMTKTRVFMMSFLGRDDCGFIGVYVSTVSMPIFIVTNRGPARAQAAVPGADVFWYAMLHHQIGIDFQRSPGTDTPRHVDGQAAAGWAPAD
jgi:hypothetical protein